MTRATAEDIRQALQAAVDEAATQYGPIPEQEVMRKAGAHGLCMHTRARIGYNAPSGSGDGPRKRLFTFHFSEGGARKILDAYQRRGADHEMVDVVAGVLQREYFKSGDPDVRLLIYFGDVDFIDFYFPSVGEISGPLR